MLATETARHHVGLDGQLPSNEARTVWLRAEEAAALLAHWNDRSTAVEGDVLIDTAVAPI